MHRRGPCPTLPGVRVPAFYHPGYFLRLPPDHPFPMDKFPGAHALLVAEEAPLDVRTVPGPCPDNLLHRVHDPAYLESIRAHSLDRRARVRLGLPPRDRLLERCARETHGTVLAARAALEEGLAVNLAGGTHHAMRAEGLGYCVLNDICVAIADLRATVDPALQVLVVDTDAHQGNGTNALTAADGHTFTFDVHVGRNYPFHKVPASRDVPLPREASGAHYLDALRPALEETFHTFEPDLVIWVSGADPHEHDRFGQMNLTDDDMAVRDRFVCQLVRGHDTPLCVLYGGGYNRERPHTARLHANTVVTACAVEAARTGFQEFI